MISKWLACGRHQLTGRLGLPEFGVKEQPGLPKSTKIGQLVHVDIGSGGKLGKSLNGERYWVAFIDDYDGWTTVKFIKHKHVAKWAVQEVVQEYERDRDARIKQFHSLSDIVNPALLPDDAPGPTPQGPKAYTASSRTTGVSSSTTRCSPGPKTGALPGSLAVLTPTNRTVKSSA